MRARVLFWGALALALLGVAFIEGGIVDATGRTLKSAEWLEQPYNIIGTQAWADGNYLLPALGIWIGGDLFYSVRILYAAIGAATIPILFWLGRELRGDAVALWGGALFAVNPYRIAVSLDGATSEIPFTLLVYLGLLVAARQRASPSLLGGLLAGLCMTLAATFRYEAAVWTALACLLFLTPPGHRFKPLLERRRLAAALVLGLAAAAYPLLLALRWWQVHGDPLYFFNATAIDQQQFFTTGRNVNWPNSVYLPFAASFWLLSFAAVLTPVVALASFVGLVRALRDTRAALVAAALLAFVALFSVMSVARNFQLEYRYALPAYGLAGLFFTGGIEWLGRRVRALRRPRVAFAAAAASLALCYGVYTWAAFRDQGVVGRRLGMLSPLRPGQYETRRLVSWLLDARPGQTALLSPCVGSPYLVLGRRDLVEAGQVRPFSVYSDQWRIYDRAAYQTAFAAAAAKYDLVVLKRDCRGLSLVDGRIPDPFLPPGGLRHWTRGPLELSHVQDIGSLAVFAVQRSDSGTR